jgi:hypothetical protein
MTPTPDQIAAAMPAANAVVKKIGCYQPDYFKPSKELLLAWAEHFAIYASHVPVEDLLEGVTAWEGSNFDGARPTPAAITQAARRLRSERMMNDPVEVQNAYAELRDEARAHLLYEAEPALALPAATGVPSAAPEYTVCPQCEAGAGRPCRNLDSGLIIANGFHLARENIAANAAAEKRRQRRESDPLDRDCPECGSTAGVKCVSGGLPMWDIHASRRAG